MLANLAAQYAANYFGGGSAGSSFGASSDEEAAPAPAGSATGGNISGITGASGVSFGDVVIGGGGFSSPAQFAYEYTPRRLATGQTAADSPGIPGVSYSSSVSASPEAVTGLAVVLGLAALIYFGSKK